MTVVRELVTLLGFTVDKAEYDKAAKQYDAMQGKLVAQQKAAQQASAQVAKQGQQAREAARGTNALGQALGMAQRFAGQVGLTALLQQSVQLASSAGETSNALTQLFGPEAAAQTEKWSQTQAAAMGRSEFDLQQYAARLGAVLGPVTKSREEAVRMSQSLSELAVDLGSFFDTSDQEAMMALRSGLTGEYESLKRYGVVLNEATLQEVAHARGIRKKTTQMTTAEKTELRYQAIIERTKAAQGDAARTGGSFANATKALTAQLKDVGIRMAKTVLPTLEKVVRWMRDGVTWFNKVAQKSNVLEAAFWSLAAVAAVLAVEFYAAFLGPLLAVALLTLAVDELITLFRGGRTVIGDIINTFAGDRAAENWVLNQIAGWQILGEVMGEVWQSMTEGGFMGFLEDLGVYIGDWGQTMVDGLLWPFRKLHEFLTGMGIKLPPMPSLEAGAYERATGRGMGAGVQSTAEWRRQRINERLAASGRDPNQRGLNATNLAGRSYATGRGMGAGVTDAAGVAAVSGAPGTAAAAAAGGGTVVNAPVNININGDNPDKIKRAVTQALVAQRKAQIAATGRRGAS